MINQDTPHGAGGQRKEVRAGQIVVGGLAAEQAQVGLMHERGRLQSVVGALIAEVMRRQPPQLSVQNRKELIDRLFVAWSPKAGHQG